MIQRVNALLSATLAALSTFATAQDREAPTAQRPNVVILLVDDLGYSDIGCYGSEIATPNLDRLAANGLRFGQFYNTGKCHSSRISLLTGLYCHQAGNSALGRATTIAEVLRDAGYFTTMTGKWHLKQEPTDRGFDRYFGHLSGATNFFTGDLSFRLNGEKWSDFGDDFYTTDANVDYAMRFIDEAVDKKKPFLSYVAFNAPHYPLQAKEEDIAKYRGRYSIGWDELRKQRFAKQQELGLFDERTELSPRPTEIPAWSSLTDEQRQWEEKRMAVFAAMVDRVDQNVGRLLAHLESREVLDDTLILFCSDNGACPFDRTRGKEHEASDPRSYWCYDVGWAHACNTPFRWFKQNQHEGGVASPLIVHWPRGLRTKPGAITQQAGHLIDVLATAIDVCGARYPENVGAREIPPLQGRSLAPIFEGQRRPAHEWLYFQFGNNRAIRVDDWKLVSARGGRWELFDLATDRTELHDLATKQPKRVDELAELWHRVAADVDGLPKRHRKPVGAKLKRFPPKLATKR